MILSLQNNIVKKIRALKTHKGRAAEGQYIVEGAKPTFEALQMGKASQVVYAPELFGTVESQQTALMTKVGENVFRSISTMESPEGILCLVPMQRVTLQELTEEPCLVLCGLGDPGNVGTLIRSAEAFGFRQIIFLEQSADPYQPKAVRASMGSILRVRTIFCSEQEFLNVAQQEQILLLGLDVGGEESPIQQDLFLKRYALILGSESHGLSPNLLKQLTIRYRLPMTTTVESLNAAIAGSILMSQIFGIQQHAK